MLIYVDTPFADKQKKHLRSSIGNDNEFIFKDELHTENEQLAALLNADILLGNPPAANLKQATNLKWVQLFSTGFEYYSEVDIPAIKTNTAGLYSQNCAETMIAGIMSLYRGIDDLERLKRDIEWVGHHLRPKLRLLRGKNVLTLGAGAIAQHLKKSLSGFDCTVITFSRSGEDSIHTIAELEAAIPNADIIIGCLPGSAATKGLFTAAMIAAMKPDALFCNVGRGNLLQDEQALIDALQDEKIAGAVLDVTANEPIPHDHPLWSTPNTILTQHTGGGVDNEYDGIVARFLENFERFKKGEPLQNIIQFNKGY